MEGPAVLVCDSTLPYTQLSSLCRLFTFSPVPLFSCEAFCQAGWPPEASCCWFLRLFLQNLTEFSWFFSVCVWLYFLPQVLPAGISFARFILAQIRIWPVDWRVGHSFLQEWECSPALQGIHLQAQFKHFFFLFFFFNWLTRKTLNCFLSGLFSKTMVILPLFNYFFSQG